MLLTLQLEYEFGPIKVNQAAVLETDCNVGLIVTCHALVMFFCTCSGMPFV